MLEAKLERYIKHCYPPGNVSEKHAKPSELSYLMYYLQTHRYRIAQATKILQHKLPRQSQRQNKLGNAVVTLEIIRELIVSCTEDLNVFAVDVLEMAVASLPHLEVSIVVTANKVMQEFFKVHDGLLFTTPGYSTLFLKVVKCVCNCATKQGPDSQPVRAASLGAIGTLVKMPSLCTDTGLSAVQLAANALFESAENAPLSSRPSGPPTGQPSEKVSGEKGVAVEAFKALFASPQLVLAATTATVLQRAGPGCKSHQWVLQLFDAAAHWAQVQLRFTMPKTVVQFMAAQPGDIDVLADYLLIMLRSPVSMVGLDVRSTLAQLLELQHAQPDVEKLRTCISALAAHTVYPGQGSDMLQELLASYSAPNDSDETIAICDFRNIEAIIAAGHVDRLSLAPWLGTQWLLAGSDKIVVAYTSAFSIYVSESSGDADQNSKTASQLARQLCHTLCNQQTASTYISAYYCFERLVAAQAHCSILLVPSIQRLQEVGLNETGDDALYRATAAVSAAQALLLAVARASDRKPAEASFFSAIGERVSSGAWFRGIICPSTSVPIDEAIRSARRHPPSVSKRATIALDVAELEMSRHEQDMAAALDAPIEDQMPSQIDNFKVRARSLADSITTAGDQRILSARVPSFASVEAPSVRQLRERAVSTKTSSSVKSATFRPSVKLTGLLDKLSLDGSSKGRLVV